MSLLDIAGLSARYGRVEVLHDVHLAVDAGTIVAVLGANGAGKTSLLRAISRSIDSSGTRIFDGIDISRSSTARIARLGIGHVPEGRGTFADFTVEEYLRLGATARPRDLRRQIPADLELVYETFPILQEFRRRPAGALSGGQAQMLAVARALLARPRLLLIDEPSLGLAPLTAQELFGRLKQLRDDWSLTIVLAEQNARLSLAIADRAVLLARGRIIHDGPAGDLATVDAVKRSYLGVAHETAPQSAPGAEGEKEQ